MAPWKLTLWTGVTAGVLALSACASSSSDTDSSESNTPPTTSAGVAFSARLDGACADAGDAFASAVEDLDTAVNSLGETTDEDDYLVALDDAESATEDLVEAFDDLEASIGGLAVPADLDTLVNEYLGDIREVRAATADLRQTIVDDDGDAFNDASTAMGQASDALGSRGEILAARADAPNCSPDGEPVPAVDDDPPPSTTSLPDEPASDIEVEPSPPIVAVPSDQLRPTKSRSTTATTTTPSPVLGSPRPDR